MTKWGSFGVGNGQFHTPLDVAVGPDGSVYVAESDFGQADDGVDDERIQKFDSDGNYVLQWGSEGSADGQFRWPTGIATDSAGNVYVPDRFNYRVQKFDPNGGFLTKWGSEGFGPGQFRGTGTSAIATDSQDNVYVADIDRIQKFDSSGTFIAEFDVPRGGLDVDGAGFIYVAGYGPPSSDVNRYAPDGTLTDSLHCGGAGAVAVSPTGKVYVAPGNEQQRNVWIFGEGGGFCPRDTLPPGSGGGGGGGPGGATGLVFGGSEGVTINAGAQFTNDTAVELQIVAPGAAGGLKLSNDGGFLAATDRALVAGGRYPWVLQTSGSERLPKTVYVRFGGPGGVSPLTFSDDIILDQTAPAITQATLSGSGGGAARAARARRMFRLRVRARDSGSGVAKLQLATNRRRPARSQSYKRKLVIRAVRAPRCVRVQDRAGNYSKWRRLRAAR